MTEYMIEAEDIKWLLNKNNAFSPFDCGAMFECKIVVQAKDSSTGKEYVAQKKNCEMSEICLEAYRKKHDMKDWNTMMRNEAAKIIANKYVEKMIGEV